ncbi:MAG: septum formation initiator family protein [Bdellovibrionales bacterium]|nr:septum formation initiator family protein [Bdellovibrionales bacterium]
MYLIEKLRSFLNQPFKIFWLCLIVGFVTLLYDGSFWNLWSLHHNYKEMEKRIQAVNEETSNLNFKVQESNGREFIERQAMDQLGLVREEDLIFVFSD